jgi:hypothetical protein
MGVDIVLLHHLLGLLPTDDRRALIVDNIELDRAAIDAPFLLIRSAAICSPTTAVLPPAAPAPDRGCSEPILYGLAAPKASRHGAGTNIKAPIAPLPQPTIRRRLTLPRYQISSAHFSSFHFSVIDCSLQLDSQTRAPALVGLLGLVGGRKQTRSLRRFQSDSYARGAAQAHALARKIVAATVFFGRRLTLNWAIIFAAEPDGSPSWRRPPCDESSQRNALPWRRPVWRLG